MFLLFLLRTGSDNKCKRAVEIDRYTFHDHCIETNHRPWDNVTSGYVDWTDLKARNITVKNKSHVPISSIGYSYFGHPSDITLNNKQRIAKGWYSKHDEYIFVKIKTKMARVVAKSINLPEYRHSCFYGSNSTRRPNRPGNPIPSIVEHDSQVTNDVSFFIRGGELLQ
jgi:hypothetical protein